jgi:hypothetical protein
MTRKDQDWLEFEQKRQDRTFYYGLQKYRINPETGYVYEKRDPPRGNLTAGKLMSVVTALNGFNRIPKRVRSAIYKESRNEIPEFGTIQEQRAAFVDVVFKLAPRVDLKLIESEILKLN